MVIVPSSLQTAEMVNPFKAERIIVSTSARDTEFGLGVEGLCPFGKAATLVKVALR
jgi:hypothetical protein